MEKYKKMAKVPKDALRVITSGRLKGKSDINPQWRIEIFTEHYGDCGEGWKFEVVNKDIVEGSDGQMVAFVDVLLYVKTLHGAWSEPIPGSGGSMFVAKEQKGMYTSDEAFKMATTDALSVAMKFRGVGADVYRGLIDKAPSPELTKHDNPPMENKAKVPEKPWLNKNTKGDDGSNAYSSAVTWIKGGGDIEAIEKKYRLAKKTRDELLSLKA